MDSSNPSTVIGCRYSWNRQLEGSSQASLLSSDLNGGWSIRVSEKSHTVQIHGKESLIVINPFSITNRSSIPIGLLGLLSEDQYCERVDPNPFFRELEAGWIRYG